MAGRSWHSPQRLAKSFADLWGLHRFQAGVEGWFTCYANELAWQEHHGQCGGAGPGANGPVPEGKSDARIDELRR